jgi:hypothetical protein
MPAGLGFLLGLLLSFISAHLVATQLYRDNPCDPRVLLLMAGTTITMVCCAGTLPAMRALSLQPNQIPGDQ